MEFLKVILLIFASHQTLAANILAHLQYPFYSHQLFEHKLLRALAIRGHNLTIFTTHPGDYSDLPNVIQHHLSESLAIYECHTNMLEYKQKRFNPLQIYEREQRAFQEISKSELRHPEIQKLINQGKKGDFDLVITECTACQLAFLTEIFDCPLVHVGASDVSNVWHGIMGNDISPALYPDKLFLSFLDRHLSLRERIESAAFTFYIALRILLVSLTTSESFQNSKVSLGEVIETRSALLITHTSAAFGHARPLMANTIQVGFMHVEKPKVIKSERLRSFLDASVDGVIVMSLGSKADMKNLQTETVEKFLNAFNRTMLSVVWKSHESEQKAPPSVLFNEWLPLADVLAHPNVKLLITHGGLLTAYEAIDREVPMIVFPLAYEQGANAKMMVKKGIAVELDLNTFSERDLLTAIEKVTRDEYKENIQRLKKRAYDLPMEPSELATWHIERVLRYGNDLKVPSSGFNEQVHRYYLDLIMMIVLLHAGFFLLRRKIQNLKMISVEKKIKME